MMTGIPCPDPCPPEEIERPGPLARRLSGYLSPEARQAKREGWWREQDRARAWIARANDRALLARYCHLRGMFGFEWERQAIEDALVAFWTRELGISPV